MPDAWDVAIHVAAGSLVGFLAASVALALLRRSWSRRHPRGFVRLPTPRGHDGHRLVAVSEIEGVEWVVGRPDECLVRVRDCGRLLIGATQAEIEAAIAEASE